MNSAGEVLKQAVEHAGRNDTPAKVVKSRQTDTGNVWVKMPDPARGPHSRRIQRLLADVVLETFTGAAPEGKRATHRNGNRGDNRISNLYWGDPGIEDEIGRRRMFR